MSKPRLGFVGIGNMGWPMPRHLAAAGFPLTVYDLDTARARRFEAEHGGRAADDPESLGRAADVVVTMLPTGADVRRVLLGDDGAQGGVAHGLASGAGVIGMSSRGPVGTRGPRAPLAALVAKAETGTLTIMIGTDDEAALATAEPILRVLGDRLVRVGRLGCGHAMKALNNIVAASAFAATAEALIVGKRFGLDPAV